MDIDIDIFQQNVQKFLSLAGTQDILITCTLYMHILQFIFTHAHTKTAGRKIKEEGRGRKEVVGDAWDIQLLAKKKKLIQNFL